MIRIVTLYGNDTVTISIIYRHYLFSILEGLLLNQESCVYSRIVDVFLNRISILSG